MSLRLNDSAPDFAERCSAPTSVPSMLDSLKAGWRRAQPCEIHV
jgi:hypothetical protein